ncbi:Uncharacterised protein [Segatella copri]|nr:Uncharacterised protein [Segatella copri]
MFQEPLTNGRSISKGICIIFPFNINITKSLSMVFRIHYNNRNGIIFIDNLQYQVQISILIGIIERTHSFSPNRHTGAFLFC